MKTKLTRIFAMVLFILAMGCGTASAYEKEEGVFSVVIELDGVPRMVTTEQTTIGGLLEEVGKSTEAKYVAKDMENTDPVTDMMALTILPVVEKSVSVPKEIPFKTVERNTDALLYGEKRVVQEGQNGTATVISKEIYEGDTRKETIFVEEKVVKAPVDEIVEVGTKKPENTIDGYKYSRAISMRSTAYTPFDAGCSGITATGMRAGKGVAAVDPKVIPLGSKIYVPGYGVAVAADTGGAIKGNKVDVCYNSLSEAYRWGSKNVTVYVLS